MLTSRGFIRNGNEMSLLAENRPKPFESKRKALRHPPKGFALESTDFYAVTVRTGFDPQKP
jgi:hypothetical protein